MKRHISQNGEEKKFYKVCYDRDFETGEKLFGSHREVFIDKKCDEIDFMSDLVDFLSNFWYILQCLY